MRAFMATCRMCIVHSPNQSLFVLMRALSNATTHQHTPTPTHLHTQVTKKKRGKKSSKVSAGSESEAEEESEEGAEAGGKKKGKKKAKRAEEEEGGAAAGSKKKSKGGNEVHCVLLWGIWGFGNSQGLTCDMVVLCHDIFFFEHWSCGIGTGREPKDAGPGSVQGARGAGRCQATRQKGGSFWVLAELCA